MHFWKCEKCASFIPPVARPAKVLIRLFEEFERGGDCACYDGQWMMMMLVINVLQDLFIAPSPQYSRKVELSPQNGSTLNFHMN